MLERYEPEEFTVYDSGLALATLSQSWEEHPELSGKSVQMQLDRIQAALDEMNFLEEGGLVVPTKEEARNIQALWVLSGSGTYSQPLEEYDRAYAHNEWLWGMDRVRIQTAIVLAKKIAELRTGVSLSRIGKEQEKKIITQEAPLIVYNGNEVENKDLRKVVADQTTFPHHKFHIIDGDIQKTVDQVREFHLPPDFIHSPGDRIGLVSHAPHVVRFFRILEPASPSPLPADLRIQAFPIPTPDRIRVEYAQMEARAINYYISTGQASHRKHPYYYNGALHR